MRRTRQWSCATTAGTSELPGDCRSSAHFFALQGDALKVVYESERCQLAGHQLNRAAHRLCYGRSAAERRARRRVDTWDARGGTRTHTGRSPEHFECSASTVPPPEPGMKMQHARPFCYPGLTPSIRPGSGGHYSDPGRVSRRARVDGYGTSILRSRRTDRSRKPTNTTRIVVITTPAAGCSTAANLRSSRTCINAIE